MLGKRRYRVSGSCDIRYPVVEYSSMAFGEGDHPADDGISEPSLETLEAEVTLAVATAEAARRHAIGLFACAESQGRSVDRSGAHPLTDDDVRLLGHVARWLGSIDANHDPNAPVFDLYAATRRRYLEVCALNMHAVTAIFGAYAAMPELSEEEAGIVTGLIYERTAAQAQQLIITGRIQALLLTTPNLPNVEGSSPMQGFLNELAMRCYELAHRTSPSERPVRRANLADELRSMREGAGLPSSVDSLINAALDGIPD